MDNTHDAGVVIDERGEDFPIFIHSVLDDLGLDLVVFRIYCHIARRAGRNNEAFPSYQSMGEICLRPSFPDAEARTLERKAKSAMQWLVQANMITKEIRLASHGGNLPNIYRLTPIRLWNMAFIKQPKNPAKIPDQAAPDNAEGGGVNAPPQNDGGGVSMHPGGVNDPPGVSMTPKGTPNEGTPNEGTKRSAADAARAAAAPPARPARQERIETKQVVTKKGGRGAEIKREQIRKRTKHNQLQDLRGRFDLETGRIAQGSGTNGAQVWYEFFSILEADQFLNDIAVEAMLTLEDLVILRRVLFDHALSGGRINYVKKILDWYDKAKAGIPYTAATNGRADGNNGKKENTSGQQHQQASEPDDYVDPTLARRLADFKAKQQGVPPLQ